MVVFQNKVLSIGFGGSDALSEAVTITTKWSPSDYELTEAHFTLSASQGYDSGAELDIIFNGQDLGNNLAWGAFDTSDKQNQSISVTGLLQNGDNTVQLKYHINYPYVGLGTVNCHVDYCTLYYTLTYIGTGTPTPPPPPGSPHKKGIPVIDIVIAGVAFIALLGLIVGLVKK